MFSIGQRNAGPLPGSTKWQTSRETGTQNHGSSHFEDRQVTEWSLAFYGGVTMTTITYFAALRKSNSHPTQRRGSVAILTAMLLVIIFGCVAFAVDLGYLFIVRTELQRSADAAALAGAGSLYNFGGGVESPSFYVTPDVPGAKAAAQTYAAANGGGPYKSTFKKPQGSALTAEVITGRYHDPSMWSEPFVPTTIVPNTVQVDLRMDDAHTNRSVALFFARVLGINSADVHATASASLIHASLLPFATSADKWDSLQYGGDGDNFAFDQELVAGESDGVPEITIFPDEKWDGQDLPPGNFGALSIGRPSSSAADLRRQIDQGPTPTEIAYHGELVNGSIISGKTGMNATVRTAFNGGWESSDLRYYAGIIGHPRFLPVYDHVTGNGTNSQFRIIKFVAVRVVDVNLNGKNKWITLQPIKSKSNLMMISLTR